MVFIESDLEKMILDIIRFNIMKERGVTELLFFNEFHLNLYSCFNSKYGPIAILMK